MPRWAVLIGWTRMLEHIEFRSDAESGGGQGLLCLDVSVNNAWFLYRNPLPSESSHLINLVLKEILLWHMGHSMEGVTGLTAYLAT